MTELKTLKEIIQTPKEDAQANILVNQLKQEAIRHIKDLDKKYKEHGSHEWSHNRTLRKWLIWFFNITEDEINK